MIIKNMINKDYKNALTELCNVKQQILKLENEVLKIEQKLIDTIDQPILNENIVSKPMETKPITNPVVAKIKIVKNDESQQKPIVEKSLPIKIITKKPKQEIIKNVSKIINNIEKLNIPNRNNKQNNSLKLSDKPTQKELELYLTDCIENYTTSYKNSVKTIARRLYNEEFLLNLLKKRIKKCNGKIGYLQLACFIDNPVNYLDTIE